MNRNYLFSLEVMLSMAPLLLAAAGCQGRPQAEPEPAPRGAASGEASSATTRWLPVRRAGDVPAEEVAARALPAPDAVAVVSPALPARLDRLHVSAGDTVRRGDTLASVTMPEAAMAAATRAASGTLVKALEKRREQLVALRSEGLARSSDLFNVEVELARARGDQARASATLGSLGPGGSSTLRSPIDGVVTEVRGVAGEWWRPESGALLRVASPHARRVEATLAAPPPDGARFELLPTAGPPVPLSLRSQAPRPDAVGFVAWFDLPPGAGVAPAVGARVRVLAPEGGLTVPSQAVGLRDGKGFVVVQRAGARPAVVPVEVLRVVGSEALVRGPIAPGDSVAEDPYRASEGER